MKLFGEYLVEKKLVTTSQVVETLLFQIRQIPSTAEVIFDRELMSHYALFQIFTHQQQHGLDFRSSAVQLGLWTDSLTKQVNDYLQLVRPPIGEILVKLGFVQLDSLTAALEDYLGTLTTTNLETVETSVSKITRDQYPSCEV